MHPSKKLLGESGALLGGSVVNGLAAYGFIALGTRWLGAAGFSPVAIVWVFWAFSGALLTFPIQHWVIRQMELDGHPGGVRAALGRVVKLSAGVVAVEGLAAALWRERLFGEGTWAWPVVVVGVAAGEVLLGVARGLLAGSGRYAAAARVIAGENLVRLAVGVLLLALGGGPLLLAAALAAGPAAALLQPGAWRLGRPGAVRPATGLVGAAGLSVLLGQMVLNGGPPLLRSLGGAEAEVTALFTALALFRAPNVVGAALTVRVTAPLTRLVTEGSRHRLRGPVLVTAGGSLVLAAAAYAVSWPAGPAVVRALFGPGTDLPGSVMGAVAAGCVLALGSLVLTVMLIAAAARLTLVGSWTVAVGVGAMVLALSSGLGPVDRVVAAFVAAELSRIAVVVVALVRPPSGS